MASISLPRLQHHRVLAGQSQRQLAKNAGVSYQNIRRLESGGNAAELPLGVLANIAAALDITIADLLANTPPRATPDSTNTRVTLTQARLLRAIATKPTAAATLSKEDRELTLPALLRAGWIVTADGRVDLHPDTAAALTP